MINITDKKDCCGCYACYNACPNNCIRMERDTEGFFYPKVDQSSCVACGICEKLCPTESFRKEIKTIGLAAKNIDDVVRKNSSSGGVFYLLAQYVISHNGIVFGAYLDENLNVVHGYAETMKECEKFRGSKYVQSEIGASFKFAKDFLQLGRLVYFSGTACQIAGLKAYLGKEYDNLICQDIACHGVTCDLLWTKYINYQEQKNHSKIVRFDFRNKVSGWKQYSICAMFENGKQKKILAYDDLYMRAFLSKLYLRPSCYSCKTKGLKREADITLADFWGVEHVMPEMDDDMGTSLVLIHSKKGKECIEEISDKMKIALVDLNLAVNYNPAIVKSGELPLNRDEFITDINNYDFKKVVKRYCGDSFVLNIKVKIRRFLNRVSIK